MKRISIIIMLSLLMGLSSLAAPIYAVSSVIGTVEDIENQVQYKRAAGTTWYNAKEGTRLYNNDKIRTLGDSRVTIKLSDGKSIHIPPRTNLTIKADSNTVTLDIGKTVYQLVRGKDVYPTGGKSMATAGVMGLQEGASGSSGTDNSEEVLQVENTDGKVLSLREDGSITDPNAAKSNLSEDKGSSVKNNNSSGVNPYTTPSDAKKEVQGVQNEIKGNIQDNLKGLFGR
jgi:hypothetical protein